MKKEEALMENIVSISKRRGFIFPSSEIYGGFANTYTYGPYGIELKNNIKKLWWDKFVKSRKDIVGLDGPIIINPNAWRSSGHIDGFNDAMTDCKECKTRFRADHLISGAVGRDLEGQIDKMTKILSTDKIKCPKCGKSSWTEAREMNQMFSTKMNGFDGDVYLRPETAGAIFVEFKNIIDSMRVKVPFGIAQIGKAFRNEIVARNFIFRIREFEQMEIEYFIDPSKKWKPIFDEWLKLQEEFTSEIGIAKKNIRQYEHPKDKLSHYSKKTIDIEYKFPFGWSELYGLAHRGDFDLTQHNKFAKVKQDYLDTKTNKRYVPHIIEPTFGVDRTILAVMCSAYTEESIDDNKRVVMKFDKSIAPIKVAVFPLLKNKPKLVKRAMDLFDLIKTDHMCEFDDNGNIGKRYRRQDEIGTPYCITVDFDTLDDDTVTIRDRDTMKQERIKIDDLRVYLDENLS